MGRVKREVSFDEDGEEKTLAVTASQDRKKRKVDKRDSKEPASGSSEAVEVEENADGDPFIKLSEFRRVTVRKYKGATLVDIREYYKDKTSGELKPGAKGVSLNLDQWKVLRASIDTLDDLVKGSK